MALLGAELGLVNMLQYSGENSDGMLGYLHQVTIMQGWGLPGQHILVRKRENCISILQY